MSLACGRPGGQVSDNHHRQRWTPADVDRRCLPGQDCRSPGSPHRYLASGRRGQRFGFRSSSQRNPRLSAALPNLAANRSSAAALRSAASARPALRCGPGGPRWRGRPAHDQQDAQGHGSPAPTSRCRALRSSSALHGPARGHRVNGAACRSRRRLSVTPATDPAGPSQGDGACIGREAKSPPLGRPAVVRLPTESRIQDSAPDPGT